MKVRNYTDLIAWQKAMTLVQEIYKITKRFPTDERYGLKAQLRRAVVSVPSNIAEGEGRSSTAEFHHHLSIAHGSVREIETQIWISAGLGYLQKEGISHVLKLTSEVGRLIKGLSNSLIRK
jgi:four helix bundle protein